MKRLPLLALLLAGGCAAPAVRVGYRAPADAVRMPLSGAPLTAIGSLTDKSGGVVFQAPEKVEVAVAPFQALRTALAEAARAAGAPVTADLPKAEAVIDAELLESKVSWAPGVKSTVRGDVRLKLMVRAAQGKELWSGTVSGSREQVTFGGKRAAAAAVDKALNGAFAQAIEEVTAILAQSDVLGRP